MLRKAALLLRSTGTDYSPYSCRESRYAQAAFARAYDGRQAASHGCGRPEGSGGVPSASNRHRYGRGLGRERQLLFDSGGQLCAPMKTDEAEHLTRVRVMERLCELLELAQAGYSSALEGLIANGMIRTGRTISQRHLPADYYFELST